VREREEREREREREREIRYVRYENTILQKGLNPKMLGPTSPDTGNFDLSKSDDQIVLHFWGFK
jgi:hypothetical protein